MNASFKKDETYYCWKHFYNDSITWSLTDLAECRLVFYAKESNMHEIKSGDKLKFKQEVVAVNHGWLTYTVSHYDVCSEHVTLKELPNMKFHKSLFQITYKVGDVLLNPNNGTRHFIEDVEHSIVDGSPIYTVNVIGYKNSFRTGNLSDWKLEPFVPTLKDGSFVCYKDVPYKVRGDSYRIVENTELVECVSIYTWQDEFWVFNKMINVKECQELVPIVKT